MCRFLAFSSGCCKAVIVLSISALCGSDVFALQAATAPAATAQRGRVKIQSGSVVSDKGTLLRGCTMQLEAPGDERSAYCTQEQSWQKVADAKLNVVRYDVKLITARPNARTVEQQLPFIDSAVSWAGKHGIYIVIMTSIDPGRYNLGMLKDFWRVVAPRYKDQTHVFYELTNEPVGWFPSSYSDANIADLKSVYDIMRAGAPQTHIILWTFANLYNKPDDGASALKTIAKVTGVDYKNESVGFHWYKANEASAKAIMAKYPVFMTETCHGHTMEALKSCEKLKISWMELDGKKNLDRLSKTILNLSTAGYSWEKDPAGSNPLPPDP